jgi:hypothetical protein
LAVAGLFMTAAVLFTVPLVAQEVEIEVAGPWSYLTDSSMPNRIILVAPNLKEHEFHALSGSDAFPPSGDKPITTGPYMLNLTGSDKMNCPANPPPMGSKPYQLSVTDRRVLSDAVQAKSGGYAVSLPKPCSLESYVDYRAKIDVNRIKTGTPEVSYTTWMVLHYTLPAAPTSAALQDSTGAISVASLFFQPSTQHPTETPAISFVLYNPVLAQDPTCDLHSAATFDAIVSGLWGITNLYREFPELYDEWAAGYLEQTHRYSATCTDHLDASAMAMTAPRREVVTELIDSLREALAKSDFPAAKKKLDDLRSALAAELHAPIPLLIQNDLASTADAIAKAIRKKPAHPINTDLLMARIMSHRSPGRTDCHSAQVSINEAVP